MSRETDFNVPKNELFHYDSDSGKFKPLAVNGAIPVMIVGGDGGAGGTSMTFLNGAVAPATDLGVDGDVYLNTSNGNLHKKASGAWTLMMNIKGAKGDKGDTGTAGATGTAGVSVSSVVQTTTSSADGGNNVFTVTLSNGNTSTFTVKNGSKGSAGANGTNGTNGTNGFGTEAQYNDIIARLEALESQEAPEDPTP